MPYIALIKFPTNEFSATFTSMGSAATYINNYIMNNNNNNVRILSAEVLEKDAILDDDFATMKVVISMRIIK